MDQKAFDELDEQVGELEDRLRVAEHRAFAANFLLNNLMLFMAKQGAPMSVFIAELTRDLQATPAQALEPVDRRSALDCLQQLSLQLAQPERPGVLL